MHGVEKNQCSFFYPAHWTDTNAGKRKGNVNKIALAWDSAKGFSWWVPQETFVPSLTTLLIQATTDPAQTITLDAPQAEVGNKLRCPTHEIKSFLVVFLTQYMPVNIPLGLALLAERYQVQLFSSTPSIGGVALEHWPGLPLHDLWV